MKKIFYAVLMVLLLAGLFGCKGNNQVSKEADMSKRDSAKIIKVFRRNDVQRVAQPGLLGAAPGVQHGLQIRPNQGHIRGHNVDHVEPGFLDNLPRVQPPGGQNVRNALVVVAVNPERL